MTTPTTAHHDTNASTTAGNKQQSVLEFYEHELQKIKEEVKENELKLAKKKREIELDELIIQKKK